MKEVKSLPKKKKSIAERIKYPRLLFLLLTFILAYFLFIGRDFPALNKILTSLGYFGTLLSGILFAYGFTAGFATVALLILAKNQNIILSGLIAGFGAMLGDLLIFRFIRHSFKDEIIKLSKEKIILYINNRIYKIFLIKKYIILIIAGFIIASPLPDELGALLLALSYNIKTKTFVAISYILNTLGIFVILLIGKVI